METTTVATSLLNANLTMPTINEVLILSVTSIILGFILAKVHTLKNDTNKSFGMTLAILPLTIQLVIFLVNGNVGTGVAVMGAFSLVRFRSLPGTAKEIGSIFSSMAVGLALGIGQIVIACIFTFIYVIIVLCYESTNILGSSDSNKNIYQQLKITVPEDLYTADVFNSVLEKYTESYTLEYVKTSNLGTLFQLRYKIRMVQDKNLKEFLNELRCRNGNLDIIYNYVIDEKNSL